MYYTLTRLYYDITFWAIGTSINDITIVIALNRISALVDLIANALRTIKCFTLPLCEVSHNSIRGYSR